MKRHPERLHRPLESGLQRRPAGETETAATHQIERLTLRLGEPAQPNGLADDARDFAQIRRFRQVPHGPELDGFRGRPVIGRPRQEDDGHDEILRPHHPQKLDAGDTRHVDVTEDSVELISSDEGGSFVTVRRGHHVIASSLQVLAEVTQKQRLVIGHEELRSIDAA